jgi:hypothetical protein
MALFGRERAPVQFHVDEKTCDGVVGWAFAADGLKEIRLLRDGRAVASAEPSHDREDVHAAYPSEMQSLRSGFAIPLDRASLATPRCALEIEFVRCDGRTERGGRIELYVPGALHAAGVDDVRAPFPPAVLRVLADIRGAAHVAGGAWTDERVAEAIDDVAFAVQHGPKSVPGLYAYLGWLRTIWERFVFNDRHFPRRNAQRGGGFEKDYCGVASSPSELFGIAHHLYVLRSRGLAGNLLEFGCFKGFSTSCLSHACRALGIGMDVFDSFAGLPPSDSTYHAAGDFAGSLDEVRRNVDEFGAPEVVRFHPGFFADTLRGRHVNPLAIWMDVDLESSSRDVMAIADQLPPASCVFSHECWPGHFRGDEVECPTGPDSVLPPIVDAFARVGRRAVGRWIGGQTGAIWDAARGVPVLASDTALRLRDLA